MLDNLKVAVKHSLSYIKYKCHVKVLGLPEFKGRVGKYRG